MHQYMAGIWTPWTDRTTGESMDTFAIVTTAAVGAMVEIHNKKKRQPTILDEDLAYRWIMEDLSDDDILSIAHTQFEFTEFHTIAKDFQATGDLAVFEYEQLPDIDEAA